MTQDNNDIEIEYYAQIIEYFEEETDPNELELWKCKKLIKLMEELKQTKQTQEKIKNTIIIMHALFDKAKSPDEYTSRGFQITELSDDDKKACHENLKKAFLIQ
jgi:hypothetical protein